MERFTITKIEGQHKKRVEDLVVEEVPFTLNLEDSELVTILCSPSDLDDLVRGFLFTAGLIRKIEDIDKIIIDEEKLIADIYLVNSQIIKDLVFKRLYTSGCGRGVLFYHSQDIINRFKITSNYKVEAKIINTLMIDFQRRSKVYLKTGGVHSAALCDVKTILVFKEDIGRHNAIDKVIGAILSKEGSFENKIMVTTGRISSEILFKIQKCHIPFIVSRSAPTNQAIKLARNMGITLIGFVRGNRMNIYSGEERIL